MNKKKTMAKVMTIVYILSTIFTILVTNALSTSVFAEGELTPYTAFSILDFEDAAPSKWVLAGNGSFVDFLKNDPLYTAQKGVGVAHVSTNISIYGNAGAGTRPAAGEQVVGYYYYKRLSDTGSTTLPRVRIYPTIANIAENWLCLPENYSSVDVKNLPLNQWVKINLVSTGRTLTQSEASGVIQYCIDGNLTECLIDNVVFARDPSQVVTPPDPDPEPEPEPEPGTIYPPAPVISNASIPIVDRYIGPLINGDFENTTNWGGATYAVDAVAGSPAFTKVIPYPEYTKAGAAVSGNNILEVRRGGLSWNIFYFANETNPKLAKAGDIVAGSYKLYVPSDADLTKGVPYVYFIYNTDSDVKIATGEGYSVNNLVKGAWNEIPINPLQDKKIVSPQPDRVAIMISAPQMNTATNPLYTQSYYIDDIRVGSLKQNIQISDRSTLCDLNGKAVSGINNNDTAFSCNMYVQNTSINQAINATEILAIYEGDNLKSITTAKTPIAACGNIGLSSTTVEFRNVSLAGIDKDKMRVKMFLWDGLEGTSPFASAFDLYYKTNVIPFSDSHIKYIGRWEKNDIAAKSAWGGAYLKTKFSGDRIKVEFGGPADVYVSIDGGEDVLYNVPGHSIVDVTPAGLTEGVHTLRIAAKYTFDSVNIRNIILAENNTLSEPEVSSKLVEFIGDSNTAGYLLSNNALGNYSWLVSEQLGVEHVAIAYTGMALSDGISNRNINRDVGMSVAFFKKRPLDERTDYDWNFTGYTPNVVVINLGGNDGNTTAVPGGKAALQAQLPGFLTKIREKYADAQIVVLINTSNNVFNVEAELISGVSAYTTSSGDTKVSMANAYDWVKGNLKENILSDNVHLSPKGNQVVAENLAAVLAPFLE